MRILILIIAFFLQACLQTRQEAKEVEARQVMQQQMSNLQRTSAEINEKFNEVDQALRSQSGRLDVLENHVKQEVPTQKAKQLEMDQEQDKKLTLLEESIQALQGQLATMEAGLKSAQTKQAPDKEKKSNAKELWDSAQGLFSQKDYKKSILAYQKYRDQNPRGKNVPEATYKIGQSFLELGMKDEAKTFFDEVISQFPNSEAAKKAKAKIKGIK